MDFKLEIGFRRVAGGELDFARAQARATALRDRDRLLVQRARLGQRPEVVSLRRFWDLDTED